MYKIVTYIPDSHVETVKSALFEAGAGQFQGYSHCSWQVQGVGQFKPLQGANPTIGELDKIAYVNEWRVEVIVPDDLLAKVMHAYKLAHPYEVPAYEVYQMVDI